VRNITDIDDKISSAPPRTTNPSKVDHAFIEAMNQDAAALGVQKPDIEPRATANVPQMIQLIAALIGKRLAYQAQNGDVYYSVHGFPGYGKLSGKTLDELRAGERVQVDPSKRDPLDFVLWKSAKPGEPAWDSPWARGGPDGTSSARR